MDSDSIRMEEISEIRKYRGKTSGAEVSEATRPQTTRHWVV
jgi:hypothetical protein